MARLPKFQMSGANQNVPVANVTVGDSGKTYAALANVAKLGANIAQNMYEEKVKLDITNFTLASEKEYKLAAQNKMVELLNRPVPKVQVPRDVNSEGMSPEDQALYADANADFGKTFSTSERSYSITDEFAEWDKEYRKQLGDKAPFPKARQNFDIRAEQLSTAFLLDMDGKETALKKKESIDLLQSAGNDVAQGLLKSALEAPEDQNIEDAEEAFMQHSLTLELGTKHLSPLEIKTIAKDQFSRAFTDFHMATASQGKMTATLAGIDINPDSPMFKEYAKKRGYEVTKSKDNSQVVISNKVEGLKQTIEMPVIGVDSKGKARTEWSGASYSDYISPRSKMTILNTLFNKLKENKANKNRALFERVKNVAKWTTTTNAQDPRNSMLKDKTLTEVYSAISTADIDPLDKSKLASSIYVSNIVGKAAKNMPSWSDREFMLNMDFALSDIGVNLPAFIESIAPDTIGLNTAPEAMAVAKDEFKNMMISMRNSFKAELAKDGASYAIKYDPATRKAYSELQKARATRNIPTINTALQMYKTAQKAFQTKVGQSAKDFKYYTDEEVNSVAIAVNQFAKSFKRDEGKLLQANTMINDLTAGDSDFVDQINDAGGDADVLATVYSSSNPYAVTNMANLTVNRDEIIKNYDATTKNETMKSPRIREKVARDPEVQAMISGMGLKNTRVSNALLNNIASYAMLQKTVRDTPIEQGIEAGKKLFGRENFYVAAGSNGGAILFPRAVVDATGFKGENLPYLEGYIKNYKLPEVKNVKFSPSEEAAFGLLGVPRDQQFAKLINSNRFDVFTSNRIYMQAHGAASIIVMTKNKVGSVTPVMVENPDGSLSPLTFKLSDFKDDKNFIKYVNERKNWLGGKLQTVESLKAPTNAMDAKYGR